MPADTAEAWSGNHVWNVHVRPSGVGVVGAGDAEIPARELRRAGFAVLPMNGIDVNEPDYLVFLGNLPPSASTLRDLSAAGALFEIERKTLGGEPVQSDVFSAMSMVAERRAADYRRRRADDDASRIDRLRRGLERAWGAFD